MIVLNQLALRLGNLLHDQQTQDNKINFSHHIKLLYKYLENKLSIEISLAIIKFLKYNIAKFSLQGQNRIGAPTNKQIILINQLKIQIFFIYIKVIQEFQKKMSRNYKTQLKYEEAESYHKDHVISTLKRQLFELKDLQHDFMRLNDQVAGLQSKYSLMLDQKERSQNQHKIKMQVSKKNLSELRNDVDNLKMQIHKATVQLDDTVRENATLKRMCDNRQAQISSLMASNRQIEKSNEIQLEQNRALSHTLKTLKQQRNRAEQESQKLNKLLDQSINTLKQLQKQARQLQVSNTKLETILNQAQKDHANLLEQMKNKELQVQKINKDLKQLNEQTQDLRQSNNKLQKQCQKAQNQYKDLCQKLQQSCTKNKDMALKLKNLQNTMRTTQAELDQAVIKRQNLRKEHGDLSNQNKVLNAQIDQCLLSILQYERINKNLQKQVENYISCDQQVRSMLNRKQSMKNLLEDISLKLAKTQEQISHLR